MSPVGVPFFIAIPAGARYYKSKVVGPYLASDSFIYYLGRKQMSSATMSKSSNKIISVRFKSSTLSVATYIIATKG